MDTDKHGLRKKRRHELHECSRIQSLSFVSIGEIRVSHPCSSVSIRGGESFRSIVAPRTQRRAPPVPTGTAFWQRISPHVPERHQAEAAPRHEIARGSMNQRQVAGMDSTGPPEGPRKMGCMPKAHFQGDLLDEPALLPEPPGFFGSQALHPQMRGHAMMAVDIAV